MLTEPASNVLVVATRLILSNTPLRETDPIYCCIKPSERLVVVVATQVFVVASFNTKTHIPLTVAAAVDVTNAAIDVVEVCIDGTTEFVIVAIRVV
jgi:hypothetical protein